MPTYLLLMNATPEGVRKISEIGSRYDGFKKDLKKAGGRLIGAYALMGGYDYAALVEVPAEKDALKLSLGIGKQGSSSVESYRAIPMDEFRELAEDL